MSLSCNKQKANDFTTQLPIPFTRASLQKKSPFLLFVETTRQGTSLSWQINRQWSLFRATLSQSKAPIFVSEDLSAKSIIKSEIGLLLQNSYLIFTSFQRADVFLSRKCMQLFLLQCVTTNKFIFAKQGRGAWDIGQECSVTFSLQRLQTFKICDVLTFFSRF